MKDGLLKPSGVHIGITDRCNLSCLHCDIWKRPKREELSSNQWIKILGNLKKWLGPFRLDISGGEPFLRNDILDIINFCDKNEIRTVVTTNATLLDSKTIKKLSRIKGFTLNISIDGASSGTHDYLRNAKGAHQKAMNALLKFKKNSRIRNVTMATILMGYNIEEILLLMKKVMVDNLASAINFQALDHNFSAAYKKVWFKENKLWPSEDKKGIFLNTLERIIRIKKAGAHIHNSVEQLELMKSYFDHPLQSVNEKCNTGNINFIMDPSADVLLCWNMAPVGNMLNGNPKKIWHSALAEKRRKDISHCVRTCRVLNCNSK
jgi:MoaA/NifB/PqqE/SkfB family radical SAM enzyme